MKLLFDVESDGLLPKLTRLHCLVLRDPETRQTWRFRRWDGGVARWAEKNEAGEIVVCEQEFPAEDTIAEGVRMLQEAEEVIGHNIAAFDVRAVQKLFPFTPRKVQDTLVYTRLLMPDVKDGDYRLNAKGLLPGALIGKHSLDAWGYRVGLHKGDYSKLMQLAGLDPWGAWNPAMEDYCENDVDVTEVVWAGCQREYQTRESVELSHKAAELLAHMEGNGFPFDEAGARVLASKLQSDIAELEKKIIPVFGKWIRPEKKRRVAIEWDDPKGINRQKYREDMRMPPEGETPEEAKVRERKRKYYPPRPEFGEDTSRPVWGDVTVPARRTHRRKKIPAMVWGDTYYPEQEVLALYEPEAPYCKAEWVEFNPGSRPMIIDRFVTTYGWQPQEFTEDSATSSPEVSDEILRGLAKSGKIPIAADLAELFFVKKVYGYVEGGQRAWLKTYDPETASIHPHTVVNGTATGRCAHIWPNIGQVPSVEEDDVILKDEDCDKLGLPRGSFNPKHFNPATGQLFPHCFDSEGRPRKKAVLLGRAGEYGWECRSLFGVDVRNRLVAKAAGLTDEQVDKLVAAKLGIASDDLDSLIDWWIQVGVDLSGIEFRMLAELTNEFDNGELIDVIVSGQDIHAYNQEKTGIKSRNIVKRCLYGLMYGAGDYKLGITADPALTLFPDQAKRYGAEIRAQLMEGLPALKKAIDKIQAQAERGYIVGLDGRRVKIRAKHSALNFRLQGDAALIATRWAILTEEKCVNAGMLHGWAGDFAMMAYVHDELQAGVCKDGAELYGKLAVEAAAESGRSFGIKCPVDAVAKYGKNWAECH
jgi:hypothetical protein